MTEVQERLMILMDEINFICQKEQLRYVLIDETAVRAQKKHRFGDARYEFKILMPMEDIGKFQDYVQTHKTENRAIESWENNSHLRQMIFRYVDKNSLLIDGPSGNYFKKPGIAITIYPARPGKPANQVVGAERYLQQINNGTNEKYREWLLFLILRSRRAQENKKSIKYQADHMLGGRLRYLFGGRDKLARWIMKSQDLHGVQASDTYWYMRKDTHFVELPENMFTDVEWIEFEGRKVCIPGKAENYRIENNPGIRLPLSTSIRVICECDLPYEEYLEYIKGQEGPTLQQLMCDYRDYGSWMSRIYYPMEEKVNHTFLGVRRSVDRIDIWYTLKDKRADLKEAYQEKDVEKLSQLLKDYLAKTDFYLKERIGFYIDDELFTYAKLVWESKGKMKYANRVYKLVPDLYKKENVDQYFAKN